MFADWKLDEGSVQLEAGDRLFSYTDDVTEATSPVGKEFGLDGLRHLVLQNAPKLASEIVEEVFAKVKQFAGVPLADDATVAVRRVR